MILAAKKWKSNADLIADVAKLGYITGRVLDPTYGEGVFWKKFRPTNLMYSDILGVGIHRADFTNLQWGADSFDTVVFDPPYKLNGTPSEPDTRYGVDVPSSWQDRMQLCLDGAVECARVLKPGGFLLWKCMDQVSSGEIRWQTNDFTWHAETLGLKLIDRFDMIITPRKQPAGRTQRHAARCYSTLLVFKKG